MFESNWNSVSFFSHLIIRGCAELRICLFRGDREERSGAGKTNQPEPAAHGSPHLGGDDLLPPYRGGVSLQAEGTSGGGQEDSGGAPELSDGMSELIIFKTKCL